MIFSSTFQEKHAYLETSELVWRHLNMAAPRERKEQEWMVN